MPAPASHGPQQHSMTASRTSSVVLTVVFLASLLAPTLDLAFKWDPHPSPLRAAVPFPALHLDRSVVRFPGGLTWYLKSNMGLRGTLVWLRAQLAWHGLGVSPAPDAVIRADPWLFLRSEHVVEDFRRVSPFSSDELEAWRAVLEARAAWLAARGIRYLVVVTPNKETIYADAVPRWFTRADGPSRLMQLDRLFAGSKTVEWLDLTGALSHVVDAGRLYHRTDTHWNDRGAFVGYRAIIERLRPWFPGLVALDDGDLVAEARVTPGGDLARMCGLKNDLVERQEQLHVAPARAAATMADGSPLIFDRMDVRPRDQFETRSPTGTIPSALIMRDSFGEALIQYLSQHLQRATWRWTYDFPAAQIDEARPRVVIEELTERKLMILEPQNPPAMARPEGAAP
jgi:alginate O-acetyltransferase complex protein AlgJ